MQPFAARCNRTLGRQWDGTGTALNPRLKIPARIHMVYI